MANDVDASQHSILVVVDTRSIIKKYPQPSMNPEAPTLIEAPDRLIFTILKDDAAAHIEQKIILNTKLSDIINWRSTSLTGSGGYKIQGYDCKPLSEREIITAPSMQTLDVVLRVPDPADPLQSKQLQQVTEYYWTAVVTSAGTAQYDYCFMLVNRQGTALGYYHCIIEITFNIPMEEPLRS